MRSIRSARRQVELRRLCNQLPVVGKANSLCKIENVVCFPCLHPCCNTFSFKSIDVSNTINIIDNLNSKYSFGKDGMSNNLLKLIKNEICESVTLVYFQIN